MPSPSGISPINLLSITWPIVAVPESSSGDSADHHHLARHAGGLQREVDLQPIADTHLDRLADDGPEAGQFDRDAIGAGDQQRCA